MERDIIFIDEEKCNGCGNCIPGCPEGALQVIDGKARLISDLFCDGLGACIGECPEDAITVERREAEAYDERIVMENIIKQGDATIRAHLSHLEDHGEDGYLEVANALLKEKGIEVKQGIHAHHEHAGCPGSQAREIQQTASNTGLAPDTPQPSELTQWPVQMLLIPPGAPYFKDADLLVSADCVAYAAGNFHSTFLKGRRLAIAYPKLDEGQEIYLDKLVALIDHAQINSLTVATMEVPCCTGLLMMAKEAVEKAERKIPLQWIKVSVQGEVLEETAVA